MKRRMVVSMSGDLDILSVTFDSKTNFEKQLVTNGHWLNRARLTTIKRVHQVTLDFVQHT